MKSQDLAEKYRHHKKEWRLEPVYNDVVRRVLNITANLLANQP